MHITNIVINVTSMDGNEDVINVIYTKKWLCMSYHRRSGNFVSNREKSMTALTSYGEFKNYKQQEKRAPKHHIAYYITRSFIGCICLPFAQNNKLIGIL